MLLPSCSQSSFLPFLDTHPQYFPQYVLFSSNQCPYHFSHLHDLQSHYTSDVFVRAFITACHSAYFTIASSPCSPQSIFLVANVIHQDLSKLHYLQKFPCLSHHLPCVGFKLHIASKSNCPFIQIAVYQLMNHQLCCQNSKFLHMARRCQTSQMISLADTETGSMLIACLHHWLCCVIIKY